jgi:hypothetical protein
MRSVRSRRVRSLRRRLLALSAAVVAAAVPVSGASAAVPVGFPGAVTGFTPIDMAGTVAQGGQANAPSGCVGSNAPSGVGDAGATSNQVCGVTLAFIGPSIGQVSTAVGPTIIGSTVLAPVTVSSGPVAVSSVP